MCLACKCSGIFRLVLKSDTGTHLSYLIISQEHRNYTSEWNRTAQIFFPFLCPTLIGQYFDSFLINWASIPTALTFPLVPCQSCHLTDINHMCLSIFTSFIYCWWSGEFERLIIIIIEVSIAPTAIRERIYSSQANDVTKLLFHKEVGVYWICHGWTFFMTLWISNKDPHTLLSLVFHGEEWRMTPLCALALTSPLCTMMHPYVSGEYATSLHCCSVLSTLWWKWLMLR